MARSLHPVPPILDKSLPKMAAINLGDARKRSNTGGSTEENEDRVILLSCEDASNFQSESELSDDVNDDQSHMNKQLIPTDHISPHVSVRYHQSMLQRFRLWYQYFCPQKYRKVWLALFVSLLGVILLLMVVVPLEVWEDMPQKTCADLINVDEFPPYIFEPNEGGMFILCDDKEPLVSGTLGVDRRYSRQQLPLYEYLPDATLHLSRNSGHCVRIEWEGTTDMDEPLKDCFDMGNGHWFGGYESFNQQWPINDSSGILTTSFTPRDYINGGSNDNLGSILHPVWASSKGVIIFVDEDTPLVISVNEANNNRICLQAEPSSLKCAPGISSPAKLNYTVCGFDNITAAVEYFISESNNVPISTSTHSNTPNANILQYPIWSIDDVMNEDTWAQQDILDYATNIVNNGYPISLLEIGNRFSDFRGELQFSSSRFSNITEFREKLKALGVNLSVTVSPFINYNSPLFTEAIANDILYPGYSDIQQNDIALVKWASEYGAVINYMNQTVANQQSTDLLDFISANRLISLTFEGGSSTYIPRCMYSINLTTPTQYCSRYVDFVSQLQLSSPDLSSTVASVGYFNQDSLSVFKLSNKDGSSWGVDNGLRSVLTSTLSLGMAGYPYTYTSTNGEPSSEELYVRWLQLLTFLPVMHISYPPWKLKNSTIANHVKDLINLHSEVYTNYTKPWLDKNSQYRYPIIRPMWWVEPNNSTFVTNDDQFLVGDSLLVAPVLDPLATSRDVLVPRGTWRRCLSALCNNNNNNNNNEEFTGPGLYQFNNIKLTHVLFFKKIK